MKKILKFLLERLEVKIFGKLALFTGGIGKFKDYGNLFHTLIRLTDIARTGSEVNFPLKGIFTGGLYGLTAGIDPFYQPLAIIG